MHLETIWKTLFECIRKKQYGQDACNVGDEGGLAPSIQDNREGLVLLVDAIGKAGYTGKVKLGTDVAASEFLTKDGRHDLDFKEQPNDGSKIVSGQALGEPYKEFVRDFPTVSLEDPFHQDDWSSWSALQAGLDALLVGDDRLVTNPKKSPRPTMPSCGDGEVEVKTGAPCRSERLAKCMITVYCMLELFSSRFTSTAFAVNINSLIACC